jgi:hypothetical protein
VKRPGERRAWVFALAVAALGAAHPAAGGRWLGSLEAGYESFTERYSIADDDTLSSVDEFRSRARLAYTIGLLGRDYTLFEARAMLGESSWDAAARAFLTRRFGASSRHVATLDAEIARRGFRAGTTYEFPNDYTRAAARLSEEQRRRGLRRVARSNARRPGRSSRHHLRRPR